MPYKKLIESVMPVKAINGESEREKTARSGLPNSVHIWWSRRPMAAARSTLFASLVDDPAEHPEWFPTEEAQQKERQRLTQMTADLAVVENAANEHLLETAQKEILRYAVGTLPTVFDPFAGSGAIPVEAHRLGLSTEAADLNAVAVLMTSVVSDVPTRFENTVPIHPRDDLTLDIPLPAAQALAEDVRWYGEWMQAETFKRIGHLYSKVKSPGTEKELEISAWIWARTVKCPNPSCGCHIPLSSSYDLARKKGAEAWVEPVVEDGTVRFLIHQGQNPTAIGKPKVGQKAVFKCPSCGQITTDAYVKECGLAHKISSQLIAIAAEDGKKRVYIEPDKEQNTAADILPPKKVPHGTLPDYPRRFSPPSFGLTDYADLFTNRQLVYLTTMIELACEAQSTAEKQALEKGFSDDGIPFADGGKGALAYAQAIRMVLVLTISKLLDRCSNVCSWDASGGGSLRNVFSRAAMPMIWDFAEGNPFGTASGSFLNALNRTCESIAGLPTGAEGRTNIADCTQPNTVKEALISTDLPYYDRASYADLSDFFYVWLKFGLEDLYPAWFCSEVSPKKEELTAFTYRWKVDRQQANAFYAEGLNLAFSNLYESAGAEYPSTAAFIYKGNDAGSQDTLTEWETFVTAVCNAGFMITASWPLARKYESSIELAESRGIPITVVFRKRPEDAPHTTRRVFVAAVKRELPGIVEDLKQKVDVMDLRPSAIGPALNIYSRYGKVLDADGSVMRLQMASRIIEQELDMLLISIYNDANDGKEDNRNG